MLTFLGLVSRCIFCLVSSYRVFPRALSRAGYSRFCFFIFFPPGFILGLFWAFYFASKYGILLVDMFSSSTSEAKVVDALDTARMRSESFFLSIIEAVRLVAQCSTCCNCAD